MVKFNPLDVFVGVGVGGALGPAVDILREAVEKAFEFDPTLERVRSTVDSLVSLMPQLEIHNNALGGNRAREVEALKEEMRAGAELINGLLKVNEWSCWKADYTDQLVELDESLKRHLRLLQVQGVSDGMETLGVTKDTSKDVKKGLSMTEGISKDMKEGLDVTKDTSKDVKKGLSLTEGVSKNMKEVTRSLKDISVTTEEYTNKIAGLDSTIEAGFSRQDVKLDEMMRRNKDMSGLVQNQVKTGWLGVPKPPPFTVGLDIQVDELKKKLLEDGVSMVLITGHAGSGKTTLAKSICQDKEVKDKFKIIFVNVSEQPNTEVVQEICGMGFQSEEIALDWLQQLLNNTGNDPVLLVLDNVWSCDRTRSLLERCKFKESEMSNYKILVTSRSILPGFDINHQIEDLNEKDAISLLRNSAGLTLSSSIPEDLQRKVVECCKRLPLAVEVVGGSLLRKQLVVWEDKVKKWCSGGSMTSIITSHKSLLGCLQRSLDALGEEDAILKDCFIDLASFPQGRRIHASVLIDMWAPDKDRSCIAPDKDRSCIAKLFELNDWRLADLVITRNEKEGMDDYYVEYFVTQHDLLRELAIHQADERPIEQRKRLIIDIRENTFPERLQMDQPFDKARLVSISTDSHFLSEWHDIQLPEAKVLVLNLHNENYGLPDFVKTMDKLEVLIVTNYGLPAEVTNFSLLGSTSKLKRIRLERISICSLTKNLIQLKGLHKISFFMCKMGQAFSKGSIKFFEAFPELQEINIDYCSDLVELPADICHLIQLKKLSITNCHKLSALPKMIGKLVNLELLRLRSCTDLSELPSSVTKLVKLKVLDISNCCSIKKVPEHIGEMCCLQKLNMRQCSRLLELPESILDLEKLTDVICDEETKELWARLSKNIPIRVVKEEINLDWLQKLYS